MKNTGFNSKQLLHQESILRLSLLTNTDSLDIGEVVTTFSKQKSLPIAIEVRIGDWVVFHASLEGSKPENNWWIKRKAAVVLLKQHSTMFERVFAEEREVDWNEENYWQDQTHAIHGGALPLVTKEGFKCILAISGLPQVENHLLAVEVLPELLARKG